MQYFYADSTGKTVGPVSLDALRALRKAGLIWDSTPAIQDGMEEWLTYAHYDVTSTHPPTTRVPPPPPPSPAGIRRQHELAKEQVAAVASQAAATAAAAAGLAKDSIVETFRSARSQGEKAVAFGAAAGLIAFVLPWVGAFGSSLSGFGLARDASAGLWLFPLSLGVSIKLAHANIGAEHRDRILRARWFIVVGTFWSAVTLLAALAGRSLFGVASVGLYLSVLGSAAVAAGGVMQIAENVDARRPQ